MHHTSPATSTRVGRMKSRGSVSRLTDRYFLFIFFARLQNVGRRPPIAFGDLCEIPGVTFPAGEITAGLVNGEIIFWTGEMDSGDQPQEAVVCLLEGSLAGKRFSLLDLDKAVSLWISLFN